MTTRQKATSLSVAPPGRLVGLDMARCLALLGMMATHALDPIGEDGVALPQQIAGGRASALFAVLAGASLALMSGRSMPLTGRGRRAVSAGLAVRALLIAVIGLVIGGLDSGIAVILTYYGLLFLCGLPFLGLRAPALALLAGAWITVVPVASQLLRPHLPPRTYESPNLGSFAEPWQLLSELTFTGYYPVVPWLAYLLAGMALGRMNLTRLRNALGVASVGVVVMAVSWFGSRAVLNLPGAQRRLEETYVGIRPAGDLEQVLTHGLYGTTPTGSWWWLAVRSPHSGTPFDLSHTIGSALLVIGVCLLVARIAPRALAVLFGAGTMTLTLYTTHVVLRTPALWPEDGVDTYARHVLLALVIGAAFRLLRRRGPLEAWATRMADGTRRHFTASPATSRRQQWLRRH